MSTLQRLQELQQMGLIRMPERPSLPLGDAGLTEPLVLGSMPGADRQVLGRILSFPRSHRHGQISLGALLKRPSDGLALLSGQPHGPKRWEDVAFVDTETTGLSIGSGTYVFLVGIASWCGNEWVLQQFFLSNPSQEASFLEAVTTHLAGFDHVVTFNGRAYDFPLLEHRQVMHHRTVLPDFSGHHDLLAPARRLWRDILPNCRLTSLEQYQLEFTREDDIMGSEVPGRYFHYLATEELDVLQPVFSHNAWDVLSCVALSHRMLDILSDASCSSAPEEALAAARMWSQAGFVERAQPFFQLSLCRTSDDAAFLRIAHRVAMEHKRAHRWTEATTVWATMVDRIENGDAWTGYLADVTPYVELAKYFEHRVREYDLAWKYTRRALRRVDRQESWAPVTGQCFEALQHRLRRLEQKITRRASLSVSFE